MDLGLAGRNAIILGASRGIGRFTAEALLGEGANVAICARDADRLEQARAELAAHGGGTVHAATADLADSDSTRAFVTGAVEALGGLDILIHNATGQSGQDAEGWQSTFDVDVMAAVHAVEAAQPALEASDAASVIFIGSTASKQWFGRWSSYGPLKGAMRVLANELGQALGRKGIRVNALSPGATLLPGGNWDRQRRENPDFYKSVERSIPFGRLGSGEEVARAITFLASPAASWINATHLIVDGGQGKFVD